MKTKNLLMAVVALFVSFSVMTAQVPAKKAVNESGKKECCDKYKTTKKNVQTATCKDATKACDDTKKAICKDAKATACKDKKQVSTSGKATCCAKKTTTQTK